MTAFTIVVNEHGYRGYRNGYSAVVELGIAGALLLPAMGLIIFGGKGRRIGDHPHCRKCGFDLFGKPPESTRCNECGTDLTSANSIVLGLWQARRWAVLSGLFMLILGLMLGGEAGWEYTTGLDWYRWLPTSWLLREFDSPVNRRRAARALQDEMMSANLSSAHAQLIAERVLKDMEAGRPDLLDEATTRRVMRQMVHLGFMMQPAIERGRPFMLYDWLAAQPNGIGNGFLGLRNLSWKLVSSSYRIGGFSVPASETKIAPVGPGPNAIVNEPWIDLGKDWSKIPWGNVVISHDLILTTTLHYRGKLLAETSKGTSQGFSRVVQPVKTGP